MLFRGGRLRRPYGAAPLAPYGARERLRRRAYRALATLAYGQTKQRSLPTPSCMRAVAAARCPNCPDAASRSAARRIASLGERAPRLTS